MSNNKTYLISILMICAVYNAAFFLLKPFAISTAGWIAYAFTNIAFLMLAFIPFLEEKHTDARLGMATWLCLAIYTAVVLILGIIVIAAGLANYKLIMAIELILLCVIVILTMINLKLNSKSDRNTGMTQRRQQ